nr:NADH dehydrogenase subunit 6 [Colpocephalum spinicollis]
MNSLFWWAMMSSTLFVLGFMMMDSLMANLLCLFFFTFSTCLSHYCLKMDFWNTGLLIIVIITGLFLIFAYLASVNPEIPLKMKNSYSYLFVVTSLIVAVSSINLMLNHNNFFLETVFLSNYSELTMSVSKSNALITFILITFLLLLVIFFIRFTYSKGGGLRKYY